MKRIVKNIATVLMGMAMISGFIGCDSDLLDTTPSDSISSSNVWESPVLARAAAMGVYNGLYDKYSKYYDNARGIVFDSMSSVMDLDINWRTNCFVTTGSCIPSTNEVSFHYKYYYTIVYRANDVINHIDNVPEMGEEEKAQIKAECKFLRACAYFHLNVLWRGVPIYTENVESTEANKPRSTEEEVWNQIITDLTDCINEPNLPGKYAQGNSSYGHVTKGAAYAFRGQAYQFMGDYAKALADFESIEDLGYALYSPSNGTPGNDDFFQLFKPANEQCDEMIFSVQCVETTGMGNPRAINYGNRVTGGSAWNNYIPNPAFVEMFECADGSEFDWEKYCPGWHSMTPQARVVFFLRDGLQSGNGQWGDTEATSDYQTLYNNMVAYGADMSRYVDQGNEVRIRKAYEDRDPRLMQSIITPYSTYNGNEAGVGNHTWTLRWPYILDAGEPSDIRTDTNSKFYYLWRIYNKLPIKYNLKQRGGKNMNDCVFCRIISGEIPAERVYEDDKMIVIRDAAPAAPVHVLMIPKEHTENIVAADPELVKYMLGKVKMLSEKLGVSEKGFRIVVNTGDEGGQTVHHLHIHLLGGKMLGWPPC